MRVKRGVTARTRHKNMLSLAKGMQAARRRSFRVAKQAIIRSLQYSYRDRRNKKRDLRGVWITRINAAARENASSYSKLIAGLKKNNIALDRKILGELAATDTKAFAAVVSAAK